jgi:iron(II)-dependent oxidoreductase
MWNNRTIAPFAALALALYVSGRRRGEQAAARPPENPPPQQAKAAAPHPAIQRRPAAGDSANGLVDMMLAQGRYALLLRPQIAESLDAEQVVAARDAMLEGMTLTPAGRVAMPSTFRGRDESDEDQPPQENVIQVEAFLLDRYLVTNRAFQEFVNQGGYEEEALWEPSIWPVVSEFTDRTGRPGPKLWAHGTFADGEDDHPVVGVSYHEAEAYARWVGKRLPIDAEWVKAAGWPMERAGACPMLRKYPWGNALNYSRANLWGSQIGRLVPVTAFPDGVSAGGALQLVGNAWEWLATDFGAWDPPKHRLQLPGPMKSIRGGAFDTYFDNQAACQFQSGENPLARKHNIGFRCALSICDLAASAIAAESLAEEMPLEMCAAAECEVACD